MKRSLLLLAFMMFFIVSCEQAPLLGESVNNHETMNQSTVLEVTTFTIKNNVSPEKFKVRDQKVEADFTAKQPGFIKRESGVNDSGEYVVVVYWKNTAAADASMAKFMNDSSVADYAQMIEAPSMKMVRYELFSPNTAL